MFVHCYELGIRNLVSQLEFENMNGMKDKNMVVLFICNMVPFIFFSAMTHI